LDDSGGTIHRSVNFVTDHDHSQPWYCFPTQKRHKPMPREVIEIAKNLAEGMAAVHAKHVAHRDLKPENVMVGPDNRITIVDFGFAARTADDKDMKRCVGTLG
jgi:serine/threonine protein kinase